MNLRRRFPSSLVAKYYTYQATMTFGFFWPVYIVFLLSRGLSYTQLGLLSSLAAGATVIGEVPTGYVGDRIGRRNSLMIGAGLLSTSLLGFMFAQRFATFAFLWVLWGLGGAFQSGSADAWLYDALETHLDERRYTRVRGRGGSVNRWVSAGTMLTAGTLYSVDPRLPFLAGGTLVALSIPVVLSFPETRTDLDDSDRLTIVDAIPLIRERLTDQSLRSLILYVALFVAVSSAVDSFIQPVARDALEIPASGLGPLYAGFTVVSAIASYYAADIEARLSTRGTVFLVPVVTGLFFVAPVLLPIVAFPMFFVMKSARTVMTPVVNGYIHEHVESVGRATILSAVSFVYALVRIPFRPLVGAVADVTEPIPATALSGVAFLGAAALIYLWEVPAADAEASTRHTAD